MKSTKEIKKMIREIEDESDELDELQQSWIQALEWVLECNLNKCWLCCTYGADTEIEVGRETPSGKKCKVKKVWVHHGCYMDMPA